jgi:hypothetical protein
MAAGSNATVQFAGNGSVLEVRTDLGGTRLEALTFDDFTMGWFPLTRGAVDGGTGLAKPRWSWGLSLIFGAGARTLTVLSRNGYGLTVGGSNNSLAALATGNNQFINSSNGLATLNGNVALGDRWEGFARSHLAAMGRHGLERDTRAAESRQRGLHGFFAGIRQKDQSWFQRLLEQRRPA